MSIVSMVDNKVVQEKRKVDAENAPAPEEGEPPAVDPGTPVGVSSNIVNQLVAYIPTEIITVWVALIAVLNDPKPPAGKALCQADWSTHWKLAIAAAGLAVLLTVGFAYRKFTDTGLKFKFPLFGVLAAPLAFVAWAVALPEGPLRSACWYTEEAGAFIVTIATVGIASLAYIFGQGVRFQKS
jgi:hypothetical protein